MFSLPQLGASFEPVCPNPATMSGKRKRAANACMRCRTRKQRCDGLSIPCKNCAKAKVECNFPEDASGEHLLREHIAVLESRINDLTAALRAVTSTHPPFLRDLTTSVEHDQVGSMQPARDQKDDDVNEDDLVNGIGFLSLTSGAEPLYCAYQSAHETDYSAKLEPNLNRVLRRTTPGSQSSSKSLIPPQSLPLPSPPIEREILKSRCSSPSLTASSSSTPTSPSTPFRIPVHLRPKFVFPLLPASDSVSEEIFATVYETIQSRYCFMNFPALKIWYEQREVLLGPQELQGYGQRTAAFFLWLTYALGIRLWEGRGKKVEGLASHEHYFQAALQYFDHVQSNITTIQALLFLAMYSFRSEKGLSAWHLSGLAIRTAVELGLHRKTPQNKLKDPFVEETRKRVWWSVYCLERTMALQLGRPIAIQDSDIDIELPLDIDCSVTNGQKIRERENEISRALLKSNTTLETNPYPLGITSMSSPLHHIRLRQIMTRVKEAVYHHKQDSSDQAEERSGRTAKLAKLAEELERWRRTSPKWSTTQEDFEATRMASTSAFFAGSDQASRREGEGADEAMWREIKTPAYVYKWFDLQYYNAIQILLIPHALTACPGDPYLYQAVTAAMHSCALQEKRVKKGSLAPLSIYTLHKLFMSGIFLVWALEKDPEVLKLLEHFQESNELTVNSVNMESISYRDDFPKLRHRDSARESPTNPIMACRRALSVYAEHYPEVQRYAECFEQLVVDRNHIWKNAPPQASDGSQRYGSDYPSNVAPIFQGQGSCLDDPMVGNMQTPNHCHYPSSSDQREYKMLSQYPHTSNENQQMNKFHLDLTRLLEQSHGLNEQTQSPVVRPQPFMLDLSDPLTSSIGHYEEMDLVQYARQPLNTLPPPFLPDYGAPAHSKTPCPPSFSWVQPELQPPPQVIPEMHLGPHLQATQATPNQYPNNCDAKTYYPTSWQQTYSHEQQSDKPPNDAHSHRSNTYDHFPSNSFHNIPIHLQHIAQHTPPFQDHHTAHYTDMQTDGSRYASSSSGPYSNLNAFPDLWDTGSSYMATHPTPDLNMLSGFPSLYHSHMQPRNSMSSTTIASYATSRFPDQHLPNGDVTPQTKQMDSSLEISQTTGYSHALRRACQSGRNDSEYSECGSKTTANPKMTLQKEGVEDQAHPVQTDHTNALSMSFNTVFSTTQSAQHPFLGGMGDREFWNALKKAAAESADKSPVGSSKTPIPSDF